MPESNLPELRDRLAAIGSADLYGASFANAVWSWAQAVTLELDAQRLELIALRRRIDGKP